jgi:hypothetical protein
MMNLHNEIMNIPITVDRTNWLPLEKNGYAHGHRDARHAAAELSLKAEARIELLETALRYVVKCNDEAMPDPVNQQWLGSPCREQCMKTLENK